MARKDGELTEVDYHEAFMLTAKKAESLAAKYGRNAVAVAVSDRYTNEEAYVIKKFADLSELRLFASTTERTVLKRFWA